MDNREEFISILREVNRPGIEELIVWLDSTDFFIAPASPKLYRNYPGGLVEKALVRYDQMKYLNGNNALGFSKDSLILTGLLADLNYTNYYDLTSFNKKQYSPSGRYTDNTNGKKYDWAEESKYTIKPSEERYIFGTSGQNSERLLSNYVPLTDEESIAIINMSTTWDNPNFYFADIYKKYPLAALLNSADTLSTFVVKEVLPF